jgi:hypothetical protein
MSNMQIKVVAVEILTVPTAKGSYQTAEVTYKNVSFDNKVETKKLMSFTFKSVFDTIKNAQTGDTFTVSRSKNDKGYWDWTDIAAGNAAPATGEKEVAKAGTPVTKSSFETAEERAKKQVYIVRQSSISAAIETLKTDKKNPTVEEVIAVAKQYEAYVFSTEEAKLPATNKLPTFADMEDDVPL